MHLVIKPCCPSLWYTRLFERFESLNPQPCNLPHSPKIWLYPTAQALVPSFLCIVAELEGKIMSHQNYNSTYLGGKFEQDATDQVINKTITIQNLKILYATIYY